MEYCQSEKMGTLQFMTEKSNLCLDERGCANFYLNRVKTVAELDQRYMLVPAAVKDAYIIHTIDKYKEENPKSSIMIFVQTCK